MWKAWRVGAGDVVLAIVFAAITLSTVGCGGKKEAKEKEPLYGGNGNGPEAAVPGHFDGEVVATWLSDHRRMRLEEDFAFVDASGKRWEAPEGSVVDGASIPRPLWALVGGPFLGGYRKASVVHDVACQERNESWEDVHRMFYEACIAGGTRTPEAKVMYWAVYHFGPRWPREFVEDNAVATSASAGADRSKWLISPERLARMQRELLEQELTNANGESNPEVQEWIHRQMVELNREILDEFDPEGREKLNPEMLETVLERVKSEDLDLSEIEALSIR